ncbi:Ionotropic receptor 613 [Blattella germanica]|nr:Ionotropic receptor 613 [Blattella germanica]
MIIVCTFFTFLIIRLTISESVEKHILKCIDNIVNTYFDQSHSILVSFPNVCTNPTSHSMEVSSTASDCMTLIDELLTTLNNLTLVQIYVSSGNLYQSENVADSSQLYLIFVFKCEQRKKLYQNLYFEEDIEITFEYQLFYIKNSKSWNQMAKYIIVVTDSTHERSDLLALRLTKKLWEITKTINFIILIARSKQANQAPNTTWDESVALDIYSWFPYENNCGEVDKMILLNQWLVTNGGQFSKDVSLFNYKLPKDFNKCVLKVLSFGPEPYVTLEQNYTESDGNQVLELDGLGVHLIHGFGQEFNFTLHFVTYLFNFDVSEVVDIYESINTGKCDVLIGAVPIVPFSYQVFGITTPFLFDSFVWIVPCPQQLGRITRVLSIFTVSSWLTLISVIFLASATLNLLSRYNTREVKTFRKLRPCLMSVWAVLLGNSIPQMPKSSKTRSFFALYVWYCLAVSMIMQTYFITYLVEPGYEQKMRDFDDLRKSDLPYGMLSIYEFYTVESDYNKHTTLRVSIGVTDIENCLEAVMFHHNISTVTSTYLPVYVVHKKGVQNIDNFVCFLEEIIFSVYGAMAVQKGNPLLTLLNEYIRRSVEAGLQEKYWSYLNHKVHLQAEDAIDELDIFFVFSITHLTPVFELLFCGYVLSALCFSIEMFLSLYLKVDYSISIRLLPFH